jgi:hypothetical protein
MAGRSARGAGLVPEVRRAAIELMKDFPGQITLGAVRGLPPATRNRNRNVLRQGCVTHQRGQNPIPVHSASHVGPPGSQGWPPPAAPLWPR